LNSFQAPLESRGLVASAPARAAPLAAPLRSFRFFIDMGDDWEDTPNRLMPFVGKDAAGKEDKVWLPGTWAPSLVNGSLQMLHYNFDESAYTAQLVGEPEPDSILVKRVEDGEVAKREAKISQRLTTFAGMGYNDARGHIVSHYDMETHPEATFVLSEAISDDLNATPSLAQVLREKHEVLIPGISARFYSSLYARHGQRMGLVPALPLFIDILRGLSFLDDAGICHSGFSPSSVLLKDGRAVIGKLGQMCFVFDDTDPSLACANCLLTPEGKTSVSVSALLQAPELEDGCPMGASDHSWTAGLIYAMMRFGYNPTTRIVAGHFDDWTTMVMHDATADGRAGIRKIIAGGFDIRLDPSYSNVGRGEQELLRSMLNMDPAERWSVKKALEKALSMAEERKLAVAPARRAPGAPMGAQEAAVVIDTSVGDTSVGDISDAWQ